MTDPEANDRFTGRLRDRIEPSFTAAVEHRVVDELGVGPLDEGVYRRYLQQDYGFLATLTRLTGHAPGQTPTGDARRELAVALDTLTGSEGDYFERAFADVDVDGGTANDPDRGPATEAVEDHLVRVAYKGGYAASLAVLAAAEWSYLAWAGAAADAGGADRWHLREGVDRHRGPAFEASVSFLRTELDRNGPELPTRRRERIARLFRRTADLEVALFDQASEVA